MVTRNVPLFESPLARKAWVMAELKIRGQSMASIARANGWSPNAVAGALWIASDPQEKAIAEAIDVTQEELFPERYGPRGERLHKVKGNASPEAGNVKNAQAA